MRHTDVEKCEVDECEFRPETLVYSRAQNKVLACCYKHADIISKETNPEIVTTCVNCNCMLPIN